MTPKRRGRRRQGCNGEDTDVRALPVSLAILTPAWGHRQHHSACFGARTVELREATPPPVLGLAPSWLIPAWVTGRGRSCGSPAAGGMGSRERPEAPSLLVAAFAGLGTAAMEMIRIINNLVVMI